MGCGEQAQNRSDANFEQHRQDRDRNAHSNSVVFDTDTYPYSTDPDAHPDPDPDAHADPDPDANGPNRVRNAVAASSPSPPFRYLRKAAMITTAIRPRRTASVAKRRVRGSTRQP